MVEPICVLLNAVLFHSPHLCSTLPASHIYLIRATPITCFQSVWLSIKTPAPHMPTPGLSCGSLYMNHHCLCQPYLFSTIQPCLNTDAFLSLLSLTMGSAFALLVLVCVGISCLAPTIFLWILTVAPCWMETSWSCHTGFSVCWKSLPTRPVSWILTHFSCSHCVLKLLRKYEFKSIHDRPFVCQPDLFGKRNIITTLILKWICK